MVLQTQNKIGAATKQAPSNNKKLILALSGIVLSILLTSLDGTIVSTAMPPISAQLPSFSLYSWVIKVYLLTSTASIPVAGKLCNIFGRKYVGLVAGAIFRPGSALTGISYED